MSSLVREVGALVLLVTALALLYNAFNPAGLPLLRSEQRLPTIADSVLLQELAALAPDTGSTSPAPKAAPDTAAQPSARMERPAAQNPAERSPTAARHPAAADTQGIWAIRYEQLVQLLKHPEVLLIDARRPEDFQAGHIPGARNIFAYEFQLHIPELIVLPRTKPVVIYCDGGQCELSHYLAEQLRTLGFRRIYIYEGGWAEWRTRHP